MPSCLLYCFISPSSLILLFVHCFLLSPTFIVSLCRFLCGPSSAGQCSWLCKGVIRNPRGMLHETLQSFMDSGGFPGGLCIFPFPKNFPYSASRSFRQKNSISGSLRARTARTSSRCDQIRRRAVNRHRNLFGGLQRSRVRDSAECDRAKTDSGRQRSSLIKFLFGTHNSGGVIYDLVNRYISPAAREVHWPQRTRATETKRKQAGAKHNRELCTGRGEQFIRWTQSEETAAQRCSRSSDCETVVADHLRSGSKSKERNAITPESKLHIRERIHLIHAGELCFRL